jgi:hypothetical protein
MEGTGGGRTERDRETETETETETERDRDRERGRERGRERHRDTQRHTQRHRERERWGAYLLHCNHGRRSQHHAYTAVPRVLGVQLSATSIAHWKPAADAVAAIRTDEAAPSTRRDSPPITLFR